MKAEKIKYLDMGYYDDNRRIKELKSDIFKMV